MRKQFSERLQHYSRTEANFIETVEDLFEAATSSRAAFSDSVSLSAKPPGIYLIHGSTATSVSSSK